PRAGRVLVQGDRRHRGRSAGYGHVASGAGAPAAAAVPVPADEGRGVTMTCEQTLPLLSAYFDRELDVTKSLEVERHVRECDRCSAAVRQHEALRTSLSAAA